MPITDAEWASVQALIEKKVADKGEPFVTDKVIKRDPDQRVIWTKEFGDEPIPIVDFNSLVRTFDSTASGISVRNVTGNAIVPEIGDTVLIARELGTRRLPRCLGVIGGNGLVPSEASLTDKPPPMAGGGGGGSVIYEQPNTPAEPVVMGSLWVDTDEQPPMWVAQIPLVSALPSNPFDGQEIYYAPAVGSMWHFRYNAAAAGAKWEFIGGTKLAASNLVAQNVGTTTPTVVPPQITLPLAGDYDFAWGARIYVQNPAGQNAILALYINGVQQSPFIDHYQGTAGANVTLHATNPVQHARKSVMAAGYVADLRMWAGSGTATSDNRWIEATPVRVG